MRASFLSVALVAGAVSTAVAGIGDGAPAQSRAVKPGDGTIDASRIAPYDNALVVTQIFPDGRKVTPGIWTDQVRLREVGGRKVVVRTQGLSYYDGRNLTSVDLFDPKTFAPVKDIQKNPDGSSETWTFDGTHVEGRLVAKPGAAEELKKYDFDAPFYDFNCCMRSIVMAMIPLRIGTAVTIPAFEGTDGLTHVTLKVVGREKVRAGARGVVEAWRVETPLLGGYIRFWLDERPPYLLRMTLSANTVSAYAQSFDMIGAEGVVADPPPMPDAFGHGEPPPPAPRNHP